MTRSLPFTSFCQWQLKLLAAVELIQEIGRHITAVGLGGWLHTEINVRYRELNPDKVAHPSTNRTGRRLTSLIETNALPLRQVGRVAEMKCERY